MNWQIHEESNKWEKHDHTQVEQHEPENSEDKTTIKRKRANKQNKTDTKNNKQQHKFNQEMFYLVKPNDIL